MLVYSTTKTFHYTLSNHSSHTILIKQYSFYFESLLDFNSTIISSLILNHHCDYYYNTHHPPKYAITSLYCSQSTPILSENIYPGHHIYDTLIQSPFDFYQNYYIVIRKLPQFSKISPSTK